MGPDRTESGRLRPLLQRQSYRQPPYAASVIVRKPRFWRSLSGRDEKQKQEDVGTAPTHTSICVCRRARLLPSPLACLDDPPGISHEAPGWRSDGFSPAADHSSTCADGCQISGALREPSRPSQPSLAVGRQAQWASVKPGGGHCQTLNLGPTILKWRQASTQPLLSARQANRRAKTATKRGDGSREARGNPDRSPRTSGGRPCHGLCARLSRRGVCLFSSFCAFPQPFSRLCAYNRWGPTMPETVSPRRCATQTATSNRI